MMRLLTLLLFASCGIFNWLPAQTATIQGQILAADSKLPLSGANITVVDTQRGTMSNARGVFTLKRLPTSPFQLRIDYIGYADTILQVTANALPITRLTIYLKPRTLTTPELRVTTTRYEKELSEVALPLSVRTHAELMRTAPLTVADALKSEPGLALGRDGIWGTHLVVRGLSRNNLVTLVDGNRIDTSPEIAATLSLIDVNDIERIEVMRGAGSALYGTGATGGVVNVITRRGHYLDQVQLQGGIQGGFGSVNSLGQGHLHFTLGSNHWYTYLSSTWRQARNVQTPLGELAHSQFQDQNLSAKIGIQPHPNYELKLNYQRFRADDVGIPGAAPLFPNNAEVRYPIERRELWSAELVRRNWSTWLRQTTLKYFQQDITREVENIPHTVQNLPAQNGQPPRRVQVLKITPGAEHQMAGLQFQSDWLFNGRHYVVTGLDFWQKAYQGRREKFQQIEVLNPANNTVVQTIFKEIGELPLPNSEYQSTGVYLQDDIHLWRERLMLILGSRGDYIQIQNADGYNPVYEITAGVRNDQPATQKLIWPAEKANDISWSAHLSLLYHLTSNWQITLNGARSFRSPSLEERFQFVDLGNLVKIGDPQLVPERGQFFDLGVKWSRPTLWFTLNTFWNELSNLVVDLPAQYEGRPALQKVNVGQARLIGFDGQLDWHPYPTLTLFGSVAYVRGEDRQLDTALPQIPPLNGRVGLRYQFLRLGEINGTLNMFATQNQVATGEFRTPGYTTVDFMFNSRPVSLGYVVQHLVLGVENVLDRAYRNHLASNRGQILVEPGRNWVAKWYLEF